LLSLLGLLASDLFDAFNVKPKSIASSLKRHMKTLSRMNHVLVGGQKHYLIYMNDVDVPLCSGRHTTARLVPRDDPVAAGQGSHPCADPTTRTALTTPNNINTHAHTHTRTDGRTHTRDVCHQMQTTVACGGCWRQCNAMGLTALPHGWLAVPSLSW
jgi:hypothetical protein